jgi:hypothetical protein
MPKKSMWESNLWKMIVAIGTVLGIISYLLQISGKVDFFNSLILPIINFFTMPVPLYSIPLAFIVVLAIILVIAYVGGSSSVTITNPLEGADFLDDKSARYIAVLCRTPQTTDFLKQSYEEVLRRYGGYKFEDCLRRLEREGLVVFQDGLWVVTQKALDYIAKYHGDEHNASL